MFQLFSSELWIPKILFSFINKEKSKIKIKKPDSITFSGLIDKLAKWKYLSPLFDWLLNNWQLFVTVEVSLYVIKVIMTSQKNTNTNKKINKGMTKDFLVKPYFLQKTVIKFLYFLIVSTQLKSVRLHWTFGLKLMVSRCCQQVHLGKFIQMMTFVKLWGNHWSLVDGQ